MRARDPDALRRALLRRFRSAGAGLRRLLWTLLRELADENAYARHLARHGATPSAEEWRRFTAERMQAKYARTRCC